ncbi:MAG: carboxypeptidase-like regulatory domain-containing protein, partial [Bacteroides acidifaciens]|nr:carboxypeptidase-like regulatory domain-containing protein [Bacteroides acidifaciens]
MENNKIMCSILVKIRKYILTITFFLVILPVFAENSTIDQQEHFTFELKDTSIKDVLSLIEKKSQYIFLYYETAIDVSKKVTLKVRDKSISELLDILFAGSSIHYEIKNRQIILSKASEVSQQVIKEKKITGHVRDKNGEAIIGGNILVKGSSIGTITDMDGAYSLKVPENAILVVSFIGYKTKEVPVGRQNVINIVLSDNQEVLDEVVVIGYGTQKKADLTGAVANISADKLSSQSNTNIGQALQGKIAGVDIVSQGGAPGAGTRIMIRGIGTLNNATPLYILDGMYMDN